MYRIDVQDKINVQVGKFFKNIKPAGQNRRAGGKFFLKNIKRAERNTLEFRINDLFVYSGHFFISKEKDNFAASFLK